MYIFRDIIFSSSFARVFMNQLIIITAFFLAYFMVSGLATTNILRLTSGNTLPVLSSKCVCDNCGKKITPFFQLPIISFILCRGKCRSCKAKIPVYPLILECVICFGMFITALIFKFSYVGVFVSFVFYEAVRIFMVIKKGKRDSDFPKQYAVAVFAMLPFLLLILFIALLYQIV